MGVVISIIQQEIQNHAWTCRDEIFMKHEKSNWNTFMHHWRAYIEWRNRDSYDDMKLSFFVDVHHRISGDDSPSTIIRSLQMCGRGDLLRGLPYKTKSVPSYLPFPLQRFSSISARLVKIVGMGVCTDWCVSASPICWDLVVLLCMTRYWMARDSSVDFHVFHPLESEINKLRTVAKSEAVLLW